MTSRCGVAGISNTLVGGVALHHRVHLGIGAGVAPFLPLDDRERKRVVEHRGQAVDEGDLGHHGPEQLRGQVGDGPHEQSPADPPRATRRSGAVHRSSISLRAHATKSLKVLGLARSLPSSYQRRPSSPPPRTWAMAKTNPRSRRLRRSDEKIGSMRVLVGAVAVQETRARCRPGATSRRATIDIGTAVPSGAVGPQPLGGVSRRVVVAEDRLALAQHGITGVEVEVVDRTGGDQGRVLVTKRPVARTRGWARPTTPRGSPGTAPGIPRAAPGPTGALRRGGR